MAKLKKSAKKSSAGSAGAQAQAGHHLVKRNRVCRERFPQAIHLSAGGVDRALKSGRVDAVGDQRVCCQDNAAVLAYRACRPDPCSHRLPRALVPVMLADRQ